MKNKKSELVINEALGWILLAVSIVVMIILFIMIAKRGNIYLDKLKSYVAFSEAAI